MRALPQSARAALRNAWLWTDPFRYVLGAIRDALARTVVGLQVPHGARVLDYGCGGRPYRSLFPPECSYVAADLPDNASADLKLDGQGRVPAPDASFDIVVSTQVLEHVTDPSVYLDECRRLLKPGGTLVLSTHGLMFYHPFPRDLWRWTAEGLALTIGTAGFAVRSTEGIVGLVPAAIWLVMFNHQAVLPWGLRHLYVLLGNVLMLVTDRLTSDASRLKNANTYVVVAERGPSGAA